MVEPAPRRGGGGRSEPLSRTMTRRLLRAFRTGDGAVCRQYPARGSQRGGAPERQLHVRQRTSRAALWDNRAIYGSRFRRVTLTNPAQRGGLARGGSCCWRPRRIRTARHRSCAVSGCSTTSSVCPVPPPPPGVDTNLDVTIRVPRRLSIRERLAQHRQKSLVCQLSLGHRSARVHAGEFRRAIGGLADRRRIGGCRSTHVGTDGER